MARLCWLAPLSILVVLACRSTAQTLDASSDPFAGDARMARRVSLRVEGLPVCELLDRIAQKTGVDLSVERDIGDEKVVAFNAPRPLRDILTDLALLFHNGWTRVEQPGERPRYRMARSSRSRRYEDGLAQAATRRVLAALRAQVEALGESPEQLAKRPESDPIRRNLSNPKSRLGTMLYGALGPTQLESLLADHACFVRFSDLTPPQQAAVRSAFAGFIAENHAEIQRMQERFPGAVIENHRLEQQDLDNDSVRFFVDGGAGCMQVAFSLTGDLMTAGTISTIDKPERFLLPPHGNPYSGAAVPASAPLPDPKTVSEAMREKEWLDKLRVLAEASGTPVMADYFRAKGMEALFVNPDPALSDRDKASAVSCLDALCQRQGALWWASGKTLLLRSRAWYETRRYEIPDRWMLRLIKSLQDQHGVPTYGDVLRLLELTPEQMVGLQSGLHNADSHGERQDGFVQEKELLAARNLLDVLRDGASPMGNQALVPSWEELVKRKADNSLPQVVQTYSTLAPRQRGLILGYLQTLPHQYTPEESTDFFALLYRPQGTVQNGAGGYKNVPVRLIGGFGAGLGRARDPLSKMQSLGSVTLSLPLSIPDDRRDRTRVDVAP